MKIRTDFVTNSSSSGFAVIKIESRTLNELLKKKGLNYNIFKDFEKQCEGEIGYISAINDSVANTLAGLLSRYYVDVAAYGDIMEEIYDNSPESYEEIRSAVDNALKQINDIAKEEIDEEEDTQPDTENDDTEADDTETVSHEYAMVDWYGAVKLRRENARQVNTVQSTGNVQQQTGSQSTGDTQQQTDSQGTGSAQQQTGSQGTGDTQQQTGSQSTGDTQQQTGSQGTGNTQQGSTGQGTGSSQQQTTEQGAGSTQQQNGSSSSQGTQQIQIDKPVLNNLP